MPHSAQQRLVFTECWTIQTFIEEVLASYEDDFKADAAVRIVMAALSLSGHDIIDAVTCISKASCCRKLPCNFFCTGDLVVWYSEQNVLEEIELCRELYAEGFRACLLVDQEDVVGKRGVIESEETWNVIVHDAPTLVSILLEHHAGFRSSAIFTEVQKLFDKFNELTEPSRRVFVICEEIFGGHGD